MSPEEVEDNRHSDPPETDVECPTCDGRGTVPGRFRNSPRVWCPQCEGSGTVSADEVDA